MLTPQSVISVPVSAEQGRRRGGEREGGWVGGRGGGQLLCFWRLHCAPVKVGVSLISLLSGSAVVGPVRVEVVVLVGVTAVVVGER